MTVKFLFIEMIISNQPKEIKAKPCISSILQELHIINLEEVNALEKEMDADEIYWVRRTL